MASSTSKPLILQVTGAWFRPFFYDRLKEVLVAEGHEFLCPQLATMGADKVGVTVEADIKLLREIMIPLFDEGKEVVIVGHSYGGITACAAAATPGFSVAERSAEGKTGGLKGIIFMAGFGMTERGKDMLSGFGGTYPPFEDAGPPYIKNQLITVNELGKQVLFNDLSQDEQQKWYDNLVPHSQDALETGVNGIVSDLAIPKGFLISTLDQGMPAELQEMIAGMFPDLKVERIQAGHSAFLSQPGECAHLLVKIMDRF